MAHKILARLGVALPQKETKLGSKIDCPSAQRAMILSTRHPELLTSPCPSCRMDSPTAFPSSALPGPCCANTASLPLLCELCFIALLCEHCFVAASSCPVQLARVVAPGPRHNPSLVGLGQSQHSDVRHVSSLVQSACELCGAPCKPELWNLLCNLHVSSVVHHAIGCCPKLAPF